jgi:hypothetical protein
MNFLSAKRRAILTFEELCSGKEMDDMALAVYSGGEIGYDPLFLVAVTHCDNARSPVFAKTVVSMLYREPLE